MAYHGEVSSLKIILFWTLRLRKLIVRFLIFVTNYGRTKNSKNLSLKDDKLEEMVIENYTIPNFCALCLASS